MKKFIGRFIAVTLSLMLVLPMLSGCSSKPAPEDAQAYVKAILDIICLGDYDHSVKIADIEEGQELELRDQMVSEALAALDAESGISDDMKASFKDCMLRALSMAKHTVGDAVATDDGGYDVTVSIEPLQLYRGFEDFDSIVQERAMQDIDKVMNMSEAEVADYVAGIMIEMLNANLDDPQYDPAEEVTVHYGLLDEEQKMYGCSNEEGQKLGAKLFSLD